MNAFPRRFSRPQNKFTLPSHWSDLDSTATPGCRGGWVRCFWHIYALWWEQCHTPPGREMGTKFGLVNLSSCPRKNVSSWGLYGHLSRIIICCDGCLIIAGHTVASLIDLLITEMTILPNQSVKVLQFLLYYQRSFHGI